jgi:arylformamidase
LKLIRGKDRDRWSVELITLSSHSGTHIDAPHHKLKGWKKIHDFELDQFQGKAVVGDFRDINPGSTIGPDKLAAALPRTLKNRIILLATGWGFKTDQGDLWSKQIPHLSQDAAHWLVERKVRAVGIDTWSVGGPREPEDSLTHTILMADNIWIIENMRFPEEVFSLKQPFDFWCLPVNIPQLSGAMCRPVAVVGKRR